MSVVAAIRAMLATGLTIEQALAAAEAIEASQAAASEPELTARQLRNRRYYVRRKTSETVLVSADKTPKASETSYSDAPPSPPPPPSPDKEIPPAPLLENNPYPLTPTTTPRSQSARASRLPVDWVLPKAWGDWALANSSLTADEVRIEAETFRDYWCSKAGRDATKADWLATWRNWIRRRNAEGPRARGSPSKFGKQESPMERRKRELAERIENEHGIGRERGGNPADVGLLPRRRPDD